MKTKMPAGVGRIYWSEGVLKIWVSDGASLQVGDSATLITTDQAEAYADARVAESQQWQPIETAPRDGRTLLLGCFNSHDKWRTVRGQWISKKEIADNWEYDDAEPGWYETSVEAEDIPNCWPTAPTHWMPLPAPPLPGPAIEPKENHGN